MDAHDLLSLIAIKSGAKRCLMVTSGTTGKPAACGVSLTHFETLLSVQIGIPHASDAANRRHRPLDEVAAELGGLALFEIAFVDPYHSYPDSIAALELADSRLADDGWMVVHDCFPPYELANPDYQDGPWCGQTFAAFRDLSAASGRDWFVLDADYGLGVLGPRFSAGLIVDPIRVDTETLWLGSDPPSRRELLQAHGRELLRVVPADLSEIIVAKIIAREAVRLAELADENGNRPFGPRDRAKPMDLFRRTVRKALAVGR
jgi:hypothetical protein